MKRSRHYWRALAAAIPLLASPSAFALDAGVAFFESEVRPLLVEYCYECHSTGADKLRGNLYLDTREGWEQGGDSGPALVPGQPDESLLIHAIGYTDEDLEMPPKQKLPQAAINTLTQWVARGAPDPREGNAPIATASEIDLEKGRAFWSFQPRQNTTPPGVTNSDWPANPIDRFILAALEKEGLRPASDADPETLLRRLHIDLTGLPPTLDEIESFASAYRENPASRLRHQVTTLLASPRFGERWGRHWLDLARYADSTGGGASRLLPDAWKYRDYVIQSFNDDKPFDRFVTEQLAGDLLPFSNPEERYEQLVATGFLVLGPKNYINDDEEAFHMDTVDEQIDTVSRVFLGMTVGCARCHDHKFDPIPARDYYALAGIFTSTETYDPIPATTNFEWNDAGDPRADPDGSRLAEYERSYARYRELAKRFAKLKSNLDAAPGEIDALSAERTRAQKAVAKKPETLMAVADTESTGDARLRIRGNPHQPAETVPRGFLQVVSPAPPTIAPEQSGRRELAAWITAPDHPLTARVYVNRVWRHLMGRGLVPTVDNFGVTGEAPTHPELLDWLANWFLEHDQSTKALVRLIVTSRTYQLGPGEADAPLLRADPANHLFGRRLPRSLDAETLRDSMLQVSGSLDPDRAGPPFPASLKNEFNVDFDDDYRRGVYLPRFRNQLPEFFETFDVANPAVAVGQRDETILSTQALYLMNNAFVRNQARKAAVKTLALNRPAVEAIRIAYLETLGREPAPDEARLVADFLDKAIPVGEDEAAIRLERWTALQQNLFACIDFRFMR